MNNKTLAKNIVRDIFLIDDASMLLNIARLANQRGKNIKTFEASKINWVVGLSVKMKSEHQHKKPNGVIGQIIKINPKKLKVDFGESKIWTIPKSMLEIAE